MTAPDGLHFDRVAPTYARGRPAYPSVLYDLLAERGLVGAGVRALEVGAGSGLATTELLARGCRVDAIEPGPHLAAMLRELDHPDLTVLPTSLEEADLSAAAYDVAVAATSLHWVDLDRGLPILHAALRPGGTLVAWWQVFGDPDWHTPFREAVDRLTHRRRNRVPRHAPAPADRAADRRARRRWPVPRDRAPRPALADRPHPGAGRRPVHDLPRPGRPSSWPTWCSSRRSPGRSSRSGTSPSLYLAERTDGRASL